MTKKVGFKKIIDKPVGKKDPVSIFNDIKDRSPEIQYLWTHQGKILEDYYDNHADTKDISLELPTGTGKTLVGLLLGEFRRINFQNRVVYLCPTRQLAHQVNYLASKYGIKTHVFVGKQSEYSPKKFGEYSTGKVIGITTYSGIFNVNPKIKDPNVIIFDDAHSAENYIPSMWSLEINRFEEEDLFFKILSIFEDKLPTYFLETVKNDSSKPHWRHSIEMLLAPFFWERFNALYDVLEENIKDPIEDPETTLYYKWEVIRENLEACNVFISRSGILIRPWIPPSLTHQPFSGADQRIYMSATLGAGGELERIIGVRNIERLPVPKEWERQSSGRRFFVFPDYSFKEKEYLSWLGKQIKRQDRSLVLCPDRHSAAEIEEIVDTYGNQSHRILRASDIEDSLDSFTTQENVYLVLTNRYDGLDLPGKACRQLIIFGSPGGTNLQEKFLLTRLSLSSLLKDRIRTRFTQASGRTTREATDYSLVVPVGRKLFDFCSKTENREEMHPELQAELYFGIEQSGQFKDLDDLTKLINLFFKQGDEWKEAEKEIESYRDDIVIKKDQNSEILNSIVKHEVDYQYYIWKGDYKSALAVARKIADQLSGSEFDCYRALWYYFTGCSGWKIDDQKIAKDFFGRAESCSKTVSWFSGLTQILDALGETRREIDSVGGYVVENIQQVLSEFSAVGPRFEREIKQIKELIDSDKAKDFERGLEQLGKIMGYSASRPSSDADPDSVWELSNKIIILFEAKSEEGEEGGISVDTCRQTSGHYKWANKNIQSFDGYEKKICVVVTKRSRLDKKAVPQADGLYYLNTSQIREIFRDISEVLRRIRSQSTEFAEEKLRLKILQELTEKKLDPKSFINKIEEQPLLGLPRK